MAFHSGERAFDNAYTVTQGQGTAHQTSFLNGDVQYTLKIVHLFVRNNQKGVRGRIGQITDRNSHLVGQEKSLLLGCTDRIRLDENKFVTVSAGFITCTEDMTYDILLQEVDKKLYTAKSTGKNKVIF